MKLLYLIASLVTFNAVSCERLFIPAPEALSWHDAVQYCKLNDAILALLINQNYNEMLAIKARQYRLIDKTDDWNRIWTLGNRIGARDFKFGTSDEPLFFTNFDEENGANMNEDCIEMYLRNSNTYTTNWATANCEIKKRFFCMAN